MVKRKPTLFEAISCIVVMAVLVGIGFGIFRMRVEPLLIASAAYAGFIAKRTGMNWEEMEKAISEKIAKAMPAIFILFTVGIVVGTWVYSGTVPMMIYYGLKIINPKFFLVTAFMITAIISTATGTAWGSAGTAGVALIGIASGLGIPIPIAAGAIVAGSVFGDKVSPLSDTTNLAALVTGVNLYDHIKHMFYTTIPSALIALVVYLVIGLKGMGQLAIPETVSVLLNTLDSIYDWNVFLWLPVVIVIYGSICKKPTVPVMLVSSVAAVFIGMFSHGFTFVDGINSMVKGFNVNMVTAQGFDPSSVIWEVTRLINRGGIMSMTGIAVIVFCAYSFAGIVEETGCLSVILESFYSKVKTVGQLVVVTIIGSIILVFTAGTAFISILMIGELLKEAYLKKGLHLKNLSRTLEDAGTMIVALVPWSTSGVFYLATLGISPIDFWMWAIPNYLCIIFAIIYAYTGFGIAKIDSDSKISCEIIKTIEKPS
ncbi:Na+/H+ antiporter NhaC [Anaeromicrobium sediminis]|nr:Na+/H+ antiporter NhaC [Anaeromicrobium sediminis]